LPAAVFCYPALLHLTLLLLRYSDFIQEAKQHRQTGADGRFVLPQTHLAGQRDAGLGHTEKEKSVRGGTLPMEQGYLSVAVRPGIHGQSVSVACRLPVKLLHIRLEVIS